MWYTFILLSANQLFCLVISCLFPAFYSFEYIVIFLQTACGDVIKQHGFGACFEATGQSQICELNGITYNFAEFIYNSGSVSTAAPFTKHFS